ncbi:hypothetical protein PFISCL1PPCAC_7371, partial [Pristionchus fissidentatus]
ESSRGCGILSAELSHLGAGENITSQSRCLHRSVFSGVIRSHFGICTFSDDPLGRTNSLHCTSPYLAAQTALLQVRTDNVET